MGRPDFHNPILILFKGVTFESFELMMTSKENGVVIVGLHMLKSVSV